MFRKPTLWLATTMSTLLGSPLAIADVSIAAGVTSESTASLHIEADRLFSLERWHPQLDLRLSTGLLLLPGDDERDNAAWQLTPSLRYKFSGKYQVFVEGGIGVAVFLNTRMESRQLSTGFQLQDRLAVGMPAGNGELTLSLSHYSNAGIKKPNDGFVMVMLGYRW
ncbi:acyloxyacyl hydrolase [Halomonas titanicae]|nr:acyloxyacyl hydrolase [Halomonas sp. MG34]NVE93062.1 acyloxyacyl hydrolase [Halomonas titanicae]